VRVEAKLAGDAQRDRFRLEDVDFGVDRVIADGVDEWGDGLLDRGVDLLLRIEDEDLDRRLILGRHDQLYNAIGCNQRRERYDGHELPAAQQAFERAEQVHRRRPPAAHTFKVLHLNCGILALYQTRQVSASFQRLIQ